MRCAIHGSQDCTKEGHPGQMVEEITYKPPRFGVGLLAALFALALAVTAVLISFYPTGVERNDARKTPEPACLVVDSEKTLCWNKDGEVSYDGKKIGRWRWSNGRWTVTPDTSRADDLGPDPLGGISAIRLAP